MNFAVIGATGYVGDAVVRELAARGHAVTAFARHTDKVFAAPNVQAVKADVHDADFAAQLTGFDAVVSAFSPAFCPRFHGGLCGNCGCRADGTSALFVSYRRCGQSAGGWCGAGRYARFPATAVCRR